MYISRIILPIYMNITTEQLPKSEIKLTIKTTPEQFDRCEELIIRKNLAHMSVPGFRKGKIPIDIAKKNLDPNRLLLETMEQLVQLSYAEAINEKKLVPFARPSIKITKYEKPIEFEATVALKPEIKFKDHSKLSVKKDKVNVTDKDVMTAIETYQKQVGGYEKTDKALKKGDKTEVTLEVSDKQGVTNEKLSTKNHLVSLGDNLLIPEVESEVMGMKEGEVKEVKIKFPKDHKKTEFQGKEFNFKITVKNNQALKDVKLDKELIKKLTGEDMTIEAFKGKVKESLVNDRSNQSEEKAKVALFDKLVELADGDVSDLLVESELEGILHNLGQELEKMGLTIEKYLESQKLTEEQLRDNYKKEALKRIQLRLVIEHIVKTEKLEVEPKDIESKLKEFQNSRNYDKMKEEQEKQNIESQLLLDKLFAKYISN